MSTGRIDPRELLECARFLLGGGGEGAVSAVRLRRATSSAYYAAFHQITQHGAAWTIRSGDSDQEEAVTRWFDHGSIDKAASLIVQMVPDPRTGDRTGARRLFPDLDGSPLLSVAAAFSTLQGRRHEADYAHDVEVIRAATVADVDRVETLLDQTDAMWETEDPLYRNFLLLAFALPVVRAR